MDTHSVRQPKSTLCVSNKTFRTKYFTSSFHRQWAHFSKKPYIETNVYYLTIRRCVSQGSETSNNGKPYCGNET